MKTILTVIFTAIIAIPTFANDQMTIGIFKVLDEPNSDTRELVLKNKETTENLHVDRTVQLSEQHFKALRLIEGDHVSIQIILTEEGRKKFAELTKASINKRLAIVSGDRVLSAPVVREEIAGGTLQITGNMTKEEAAGLISVIEKAKKG